MDPLTLAAISSAISLGGGALGAWLNSATSEEEYEQRLNALHVYAALSPPEAQKLIAREVNNSRMEGVQRNPALEATQDEVQQRYMEVARNGESARGAADYEQAAMDSAQLARSTRMGAVARAEALGLGPEASFSDSLMAGQGDADRERMAGLQRAAYNEDARNSALGSAGSMAAQRSATQWGQDADVAHAQDELAMFSAGQWNNMQEANRADRYNAFNAQLAKANGMAGQYNQIADMKARQGQQQANNMGNMIGGAGRAVMAPGAYGGMSAPAAPISQPAAARQQPQRSSYGAVGSEAALEPALEQQRQLQGLPPVDPTRRRFR